MLISLKTIYFLIIKKKKNRVKYLVTERMNKSESKPDDIFCSKACCNAQGNNQ